MIIPTELIEQNAVWAALLCEMRKVMSEKAARLTKLVNAITPNGQIGQDELDRLQSLIRKMTIAANLDYRYVEYEWWKERNSKKTD